MVARDSNGPSASSPVAQRPARPAKISRRAAREQQPMLFESLNEAEAYDAPPLALLEKPVPVVRPQTSGSALHENARMLETVLEGGPRHRGEGAIDAAPR